MSRDIRRAYWRALYRTSILLLLGCSAVGCQSYNWKLNYSEFAPAEKQAREQNKYLFVFYKSWTDSASNRMLGGEVLSDPQVMKQFRDTINLLVEEAGGPQYTNYMAKYGVSRYPASVIVAPDGNFLVEQGFMPKDQFLDFVRKAKTPKTQPANGTKEKVTPRTTHKR